MQPTTPAELNTEQLNAVSGAGITFVHSPDSPPIWSGPADSPFGIPGFDPVLFTG